MSQSLPNSSDASGSAPDVQGLIESSRARPHKIAFALPVMILSLLSIPFLMRASRDTPSLYFLTFIPLFVLFVISRLLRRFHRSIESEQQHSEKLEELVQLRQWPQALSLGISLLSGPMKMESARLSALIAFSSVLIRHHWFESARLIHDEVIAFRNQIDPSMIHTISVARAMTFLREDRLVDADTAITELRRDVNRARDAARRARTESGNEIDDETVRSIDSAGLALLELYRDIKTGHFDEGIELFESKVKLMRDQLSVRVADAWVLVARAYDARGRTDDAARAFRHATTLAPVGELVRRYPEIAPLEQRFLSAARTA